MSQRRLGVLLFAMVGLTALRWWLPPSGDAPMTAASAAVARPQSTTPASPQSVAMQAAPAPTDNLAAGTRDPDEDEPGNAFSVRVAAIQIAPPPTAPIKLRPFVGPPLPPPPPPPAPPPSLTVIGSWQDERGASVFIAGPMSVLQGRVGDFLLSEYRIAQITPTQVLLKQTASNREIILPIPAAAGSALSQPK